MSTQWRGGNWTAGNWDANNWLGPNEPQPAGAISGSTSFRIESQGTLTAVGGTAADVVRGGGGGPFVGGIFRSGDEKPAEFDAAWDKAWRERLEFDELSIARKRKAERLRREDEEVAAMVCALVQSGILDAA